MSRASKATKTVLDVRVPIYTPHSLRPKMGVYLFDEQDALIGTELPAGVLDNQDTQHPIYGVVDHELDLSKKYTIRVGPQNLAASCAGELKECLKKADAPTLDSSQGEWDDPQTKIRLIMTFPPVDEAKVVLWREYTCAATPTRQSVPATATRVHGIVQKLRNPGGSPAAFDPLSPATVRVHVVDLRPTLDNIGDAELESIRDQVLARMLGVEVQVLGTMSQSDIAGVSALLADLHRPTGNALRSYIYDKRLELAPYMGGLIPVVSRHQVDEVSTYEDGSFFSKWSSGTAADVFLEVWQNQDGEDRQLGNPDVVTTTLWKYDGTAYAMVTTDDPAGIVCRPPARRTVRTRGAGPYVPYVAPNFIGWADLRNINGLLTRRGTGLLQDGKTARPWAQTLYLKMAFDASLPLPNGALKYYRWSYQFEGDSGFTYMNAPVVHRYMEYNPTTGTIGLKPYKLGPQSYNNVPCLFEIPPANPPPPPPDPAHPVPPDIQRRWIIVTDWDDNVFARFDSTAGQTPGRSGKVTLKLELFDANGNRVSGAGPAPAFRFDLPIPGGSGSGVAPAETLDADGSLVFDILVDNNPTVAQLPGVHVAGSGSDPCGMIFYKESSDEVSVDFAARHPNNFLTWDLRLYRGFGGGKVVASATGAGSSANPDHFLKPASAILCPECPQAAFAATLYSSALATNGYGRQSGYDRAVTIAFGLLKRSAPGT